MDIEQTAQFMSHIYKRTVPGYRCHGIYKRADDDEVCAILYTHYILNDTLYTMSLIYKEQDTIHLLQCTCSNADTVEWHPVFKNIVESICFNKRRNDMTKGQCRTAISQNQQNIRQYNSQIAQLKNDIDELNRVKGKIVELQNTLADCKGASKAKLDSTTGLNNVSHKILSGIYDGMGNLLTGHPYTKVHNGLESAITTITNEIAKSRHRYPI